jgi:hypothetical protein
VKWRPELVAVAVPRLSGNLGNTCGGGGGGGGRWAMFWTALTLRGWCVL